jgi:DNA-binding CsgD family transcriptional regulator
LGAWLHRGSFHQPGSASATTETPALREKEILELVAKGYANKEIADKLAIRLSTVCWHLHGIYKKLHVQSRGQAVNKLRQSSARHIWFTAVAEWNELMIVPERRMRPHARIELAPLAAPSRS